MCVRRSVRLLLNSDSSSYTIESLRAPLTLEARMALSILIHSIWCSLFCFSFFFRFVVVGNIFDCVLKFIFPSFRHLFSLCIGDMNANTTYRLSVSIRVMYKNRVRCVFRFFSNVGHENVRTQNSLHEYRL